MDDMVASRKRRRDEYDKAMRQVMTRHGPAATIHAWDLHG
jgi:hypothetical protein